MVASNHLLESSVSLGPPERGLPMEDVIMRRNSFLWMFTALIALAATVPAFAQDMRASLFSEVP